MKITFLYSIFIIILFLPQRNKDKEFEKKFEGTIFFSQELLNDTFYYIYYVKDNYVKLEELNRCKNCKVLNNYILFDLKKGTITAVNPTRKMYINLIPKKYEPKDSKEFEVIKTGNYKKIMGYKCYQWRVRNKNENTEITYWVTYGNYDFFVDLLKLWNRTEKHASYFLTIPDNKGYFPLLSDEKTTLREQKMTLRVIDIQKKELDSTIFIIPPDYKNFQE